MINCEHRHVVIIGNEEEGGKAFQCKDCKQYLKRIVEDGEYVYVSKDQNETYSTR